MKSLLIANRGEIACRVIRTARRMGIRTIAVYSEADRAALHVQLADQSFHIGPSPARESYLAGGKIVETAIASGADAIHPGYGFLSENVEFAQAVIDAGIIWVGPRPSSIAAMGLKHAAKDLMTAAGVSVTPGYQGNRQEIKFLSQKAAEIGYPVLIKAVAGGGGKGMRLVESQEDFAEALLSCRREAAASFGNEQVLIEKYIQRPRHIEVQVFGDEHGNVVHLFERDCSLQRRHQKVIEEAPAPGLDQATRELICATAVRAAKAVDYVGAGTVEFIADASEGLRADRIWFMEMNTRLQVEHPVTEEITSVDLVEWQLRIANGEPLPKQQEELAINGWAMEARLYAEDPAKNFLPSVGRLDTFSLVGDRIETGVTAMSVVSPFYDPMIAKLVSHAPTRELARQRLEKACRAVQIEPLKTNAWFLARLLALDDFQRENITTALISEHLEVLTMAPTPSEAVLQTAAAQALSGMQSLGPACFAKDPLLGFRLNAKPKRSVSVDVDGATYEVEFCASVAVPSVRIGQQSVVFMDGTAFLTGPLRSDFTGSAGATAGTILSPMPGRIIDVAVELDELVKTGQKLLVLEAMKMEHTIVAPFDGKIVILNAATGQQVQVDVPLIKLEQMN